MSKYGKYDDTKLFRTAGPRQRRLPIRASTRSFAGHSAACLFRSRSSQRPMKVSSLPVLARTFALLVVLGGHGACAGGLDPAVNAGQGGSGASCASGGSGGGSSVATFGDIKTVIGFYCGGAGCHNETQSPNLFPNDDTTLYTTLTTYKVTKCGGRVLVKPCARGGQRLLPRAEQSDDVRDASADALWLRWRELHAARRPRDRSPVDRRGRSQELRHFAG